MSPEDVADAVRESRPNVVVQHVWSAVANGDDGAARRRGLSLATAGQRAVYAVMFSSSEICSGGFRQYFWNPTGALAREAVQGFRLIGLLSHADLVLRVLTEHPELDTEDRSARIAALDALLAGVGGDDDERPGFAEAIEDAYYALEARTPVSAACNAYIDRHPEAFFVDP